MNKDLGYKIPSVVDPGDAICVRVYVPNDTLYIGAFWSAYQYFTSWVAWARDPEHRAKDAAATWKFWFDMSRAEYDLGEGCGMNDVRQKTGSPCVLEKYVGGQWVDFADLRLCVPKMRFMNGVLQQDTTGEGNWVDAAGAGDPPYNEKTDGPYTPPWSSPPAGQSGDCLSANNVARWLMYIVFTFAMSFAGGAILGAVISSVITYLAAVMTMGVASGVSILLTGAYSYQATEWEDIADYCVTATLKLMELMFCKFSDDGSISAGAFDELISDCEAWQATLVGNDAAVRCWSMIIGLLRLLGPVGLSRAGNIYGITEADCGDYNCGDAWEETNTFVGSNECGWSAVYDDRWPSELAGVIMADGWRNVYIQGSSPINYRILSIRKMASEPFTITDITASFLTDVDGVSQEKNLALYAFYGDEWHLWYNVANYGDGVNVIPWSGNQLVTGLWLQSEGWPINTQYAQSIVMGGTGTPPDWI